MAVERAVDVSMASQAEITSWSRGIRYSPGFAGGGRMSSEFLNKSLKYWLAWDENQESILVKWDNER